MLNMDENGEAGQPEQASGQEEPEIHQPGSPETDRKAEDAAGRQADGIKQGMPENRGLYQETEKPSLGVAESVGYEPIQRKADMEMHRPADHEQQKTEVLKQPFQPCYLFLIFTPKCERLQEMRLIFSWQQTDGKCHFYMQNRNRPDSSLNRCTLHRICISAITFLNNR